MSYNKRILMSQLVGFIANMMSSDVQLQTFSPLVEELRKSGDTVLCFI